jgi:hypothetical protein
MSTRQIDSAPKWLQEAEVINVWPRSLEKGISSTLEGWDLGKMPLLTHIPYSESAIEEAHKRKVRVLIYAAFMDTLFKEEGCTGRPLYRDEDADILLINKDGKFMNTVMDGTYRMNRYLVCANSKKYIDKALDYVKSLMDMGVDGLFIDNVGPRESCYGHNIAVGYSQKYKTVIVSCLKIKEQYDKEINHLPVHKHFYPDKDHNYAFARLLEKIRKVVKSYNSENVVIHNGGGLPEEGGFGQYGDGTMIESFICSWMWNKRNYTYTSSLKMIESYKDYLASGKVVVALSFLGYTPYGINEDAFYCYAFARLAGFIWMDGYTIGENPAKVLYSVKLGKPLEETQEKGGIFYRFFHDGIVALNDSDTVKNLRVKAVNEVSASGAKDLFSNVEIPLEDGYFESKVPANSGRVYLYLKNKN